MRLTRHVALDRVATVFILDIDGYDIEKIGGLGADLHVSISSPIWAQLAELSAIAKRIETSEHS